MINAKPNICLCIKSIDPTVASGTKRYAYELYRELKNNKKYNIFLITAPKNSIYEKSGTFFVIFCFYKLLKLLSKKKIDLFHSLSFAYSPFIPIVKLFGVKTAITIADVPKTYSTKYMDNGILDYIKIWLYRIFIRYSDYFFAISKLNIERLQKEIRISKKRIFYFPHGIDQKFKPLTSIKREKDFTIGYLGGMISLKNIKYTIELIKTFIEFNKNHSDSLLIISGKDKLSFVEKFIKKINHKKIKYIKFIPESDIVNFYNSLDVFIFPSLYEGFGLAIMEAKRCGKPVLLIKKAMISNEVKKYCYEYDSKEDLIEKLSNFYLNRSLIKLIGEKSYRDAKKFTWKKSVEAAINGYKKILKK